MFRNRKELENYMHQACKSMCHEWTFNCRVENDREDIVVEKEELKFKKKMENIEILI